MIDKKCYLDADLYDELDDKTYSHKGYCSCSTEDGACPREVSKQFVKIREKREEK